MLAAISRTKRIRLGTAVTVLSTQDPVRLYTTLVEEKLDLLTRLPAALVRVD
jgi:hypothetical protein